MFYEGDLKSGINKALQESKLVACFVTDEDDESNAWEREFIEDESVKTAIASQTVLLRLIAGSQEAGYLAAIFPLPKTPTLVVIENGQLKEYIVSGVPKDEFLRRLSAVFQSRVAPTTTSSSASANSPTSAPARQPSASSSADSSASLTESPSAQVVQDLLTERGARLEAQRKENEAREREKHKADAKSRKEALEVAAAADPENDQKSADMNYALLQKKRQQEAREERARILKRVEEDKAERKSKAEARKAAARMRLGSNESVQMSGPSSTMASRSKNCAIQVRLFDGATMRSSFPAEATLGKEVRDWITKGNPVIEPFNFKQVLSPLPNKDIAVAEEEKTLQSQGLMPSATLILVPVQTYTNAYENNTATGMVLQSISAGFGLLSSGAQFISSGLGSVLGGAAAPSENTPPLVPSVNINVRTQLDEDRRDDRQFYNGNSTNFEPQKDDDDKKEA
ncbi:hypothetical protein BJ878DRAFT_510141 [Calycina marina]|uniref:UBX domain-containing protein 2 n=1 Tax=Calycina marina TaxID=1763456 RepID=A0A9P7Z0X9_9HELO|nr:hypothetical protein BJ878DRAFT_510141 [Calycina marina]